MEPGFYNYIDVTFSQCDSSLFVSHFHTPKHFCLIFRPLLSDGYDGSSDIGRCVLCSNVLVKPLLYKWCVDGFDLLWNCCVGGGSI